MLGFERAARGALTDALSSGCELPSPFRRGAVSKGRVVAVSNNLPGGLPIIVVRRLAASDIPSVAGVFSVSPGAAAWSAESLLESARTGCDVWIAETTGEVVGVHCGARCCRRIRDLKSSGGRELSPPGRCIGASGIRTRICASRRMQPRLSGGTRLESASYRFVRAPRIRGVRTPVALLSGSLGGRPGAVSRRELSSGQPRNRSHEIRPLSSKHDSFFRFECSWRRIRIVLV